MAAGEVARDPAVVPSDAELQRAIDLLETRFGLDALFVLGSHATGATHRESDLDLAALDALDRQDGTGLNLQRGVQAMIDLATHVVAREGLGVPDDLAASCELLERSGTIESELADRMRRMTGFRNGAVPENRKLDPAIVDAIVRDRIGNLRAFARATVERFRI